MALRDTILIMVLIFMFGVGFFTIHYVLNTVTDEMIATPQINQSAGAVISMQGTKDVTNRLDYVVFGLAMGLILALIISSWFVGGHPIFMFIYFIVVAVGTAMSAIFAHIWYEISQNTPIFGTTVANFPITDHLLSNAPYYMAIVGAIGIIVMFAKPYFADQG